MPDEPDETTLRAAAREVIRIGRIPSRLPDRTWGGRGIGAPCTICTGVIRRDQMEFEIQFEHGGPTPGLDRFHVHVRCFAAWEFERPQSVDGHR
jgi:hypothetical protein